MGNTAFWIPLVIGATAVAGLWWWLNSQQKQVSEGIEWSMFLLLIVLIIVLFVVIKYV